MSLRATVLSQNGGDCFAVKKKSAAATFVLDVSELRAAAGQRHEQIAHTRCAQVVRDAGIRGKRGGFAQCLCGGARGTWIARRIATIASGTRGGNVVATAALGAWNSTTRRRRRSRPGAFILWASWRRCPLKPLVARMDQNRLAFAGCWRAASYDHLLVPTEEPADAALCESM